MKFLLPLFLVASLSHAKSADDLNASRMSRVPSADLYLSDKYAVSVVNDTPVMKALKKAYKCKGTEVLVGEKEDNLTPKTVRYTCHGKDHDVQVEASLKVAGWGETTDITFTILGVPGATN